MTTIPARTKRYGFDVDLPQRHALRAGPVTAVLENADLRYVKLGATQIVLRLYVAIRDRNWATIEPRFTRFVVHNRGDSFTVELEAENVSAEVDFVWGGVIEGSPDGTIRYTMAGSPRKAFLRNRIGFCVLHPMELAGLPATVETPEGTHESQFPDLISPHQPFIDMVAISHPAGPDGRATIRFEGDLFEAEDQRNWTDASYKTYSTPLRLPYPVEVTRETRVTQAVTISVSGKPFVSVVTGAAPDVTIDLTALSPMPAFGFGGGRKPLPDGEDLKRLRALKPAHLHSELDLSDESWRERLATAAGNAQAVASLLDLSVVGGRDDSGWDELATAIKDGGIAAGRVYAFPPVTYPIVFPRFDLATHPETIAAAKRAFSEAVVEAAIGGGTRAFFTELNRASDFLPVDDLDAVTYTINATVHAVDNLSVIETLAAQGETVGSARAIVGDKPLAVGPITFKPTWNPNATGAPPEPGPEQLPDPVDPRQLSLFGAGWTLGSIHRLAAAGADSLTYYELTGWRGVQEKLGTLTRQHLFPSSPGQLFPLYHVFAAMADFAAGEVASVALADGLTTEALAVRAGDRARILVASFAEEQHTVTISAPGLRDAVVRTLDEESYDAASNDPAFFTRGGQPVAVKDGQIALSMRPFAVACVEGRI